MLPAQHGVMPSRIDQTNYSRSGVCAAMSEWAKTVLVIGLLVLAILFAQSRRNCEIPGSTWIPCIWGKALKQPAVEPSPERGRLRFQ
jgi:hypothetical protein